MQALLTNRMALDFAARDKDDPTAVQRINFGLYFFNGASSFKDLGQSTHKNAVVRRVKGP